MKRENADISMRNMIISMNISTNITMITRKKKSTSTITAVMTIIIMEDLDIAMLAMTMKT